MNAKKICILLVCVLFFVSVVPVNTQAVSVVLDNDGTPMDNPYGRCDVRPSFDADYYDCYIPYSLTCEQVGGISVGGNGVMSTADRQKKISAKFNYEGSLEWDYTQNFLQRYAGNYEAGICEHTDAVVLTGEDGTQFYMAAIPYFCYASNLDGTSGFPGWSTENRGQVYDLILTDGTVLHFIVGDAKAQIHTNGGGNGYYVHNELNYEQYRYLFQSYAGETVEIFGKNSGCVSKFMNYYNIGSGEDQNQVAYIRMYNLRIRDGDAVRKSGIPSGVGYTHDNVSIVANRDASGSTIVTDENGNPISVTLVPECDLTGMPESFSIGSEGADVPLPGRDELTIHELNSLQASKDAIDYRNSIKLFDFSRHLMVFIGLLLLVYVLLILFSAMFDKVNSFIDISLVSVFTFGAIKVSDDEETRGQVGYASNTKLFVSIGIMAIVSMLLISGAVIPGVMKAVQSVFDWISGIF